MSVVEVLSAVRSTIKGVEPNIPCVSGGKLFGYKEKWGDRWGSNPRQPEPQSGALPTELRSP